MIKKFFTRRTDVPHDSIQRRGVVCGITVVFTWAFMGFFQEEFPFYAPLFLTILIAVSIHEMGFEFIFVPVLFVLVHALIVLYCFMGVDPVDYRVFFKLGLWVILFLVIPFLYMFIWTTILDLKPTKTKTPNTNT